MAAVRRGDPVRIVAVGVLLIVFGSSAWVGEDAHITFRTIDNFVNGYGLRWNVDERVQTFTHPLWMLVNASAYYFTREIYTTTTALGLLFSLAAVATAVGCFPGPRRIWLLGLVVPLVFSGAFVRYTTSGFENSLSFLLVAVFARLLLRRGSSEPAWLGIGLVVGLAAMNRLDSVLVYLPAIGLVMLRHRAKLRWGRLVAGATPAALWYAFANFYYGFALPNTALAKLNEEIPRAEYVTQGLVYALDLLPSDAISFSLIAFGIGAALLAAQKAAVRRKLDGVDTIGALAIGSSLYVLYVVSIGGDFLSGRFWALPVFVSAIVFTAHLPGIAHWLRRVPPRQRALLIAAIIGVALANRFAAPDWEGLARSRGIIEMPVSRKFLDTRLHWVATETAQSVERFARSARQLTESTGARRVTVGSAVGFSGYYSGPLVTIVDLHALTDPLLARLPPVPRENWRIGHFERSLPQGYLHARRTGSLDRMTPAMRDYYTTLRQITSGPLLDTGRLGAIAAMHLGRVSVPIDAASSDAASVTDGNR